MKKLLVLIGILMVGSGSICQARQSFIASLSSANEVPPNDLSATEGTYGVGYFSLSGMTLNVTGGFYDYSYPVSEISLYDGPVTLSAPPLFQLTIDPDASPVGGGFYDGTFSGSAALTAGEITDLENNDFNVNVQTSVTEMEGLPGEMSGVFMQVPEPSTMILMSAGSLAWLGIRRRKAFLVPI